MVLTRVLPLILVLISVPSEAASLRIFLNTPSRVYVDGNLVDSPGRGVIKVDELVVGRRYTLSVIPWDTGYQPWSGEVVLREGVPNSVQITLVRIPTHGVVVADLKAESSNPYLFWRLQVKLPGQADALCAWDIPRQEDPRRRACLLKIGSYATDFCLTVRYQLGGETQVRRWGCKKVDFEVKGDEGTAFAVGVSHFESPGTLIGDAILSVEELGSISNCVAVEARRASPACFQKE